MSPYEPTKFRSWLSPADAMTVLEITHGCISCRTEGAFRLLFPRMQELLPFDHAVAVAARRGARRGVLMLDAINHSYPESFLTEYVSRNYFRVDNVMLDAITTCRAHYCFEGTDGRPPEITALCRDFGLSEGYVLGSRSAVPGAGGSLFVLKSRSLRREPRAAAVMDLLAPHLHLALYQALDVDRPRASPVALSAREREVMRWLNEGKSSWEASVILGVSERTVNFHVYNVIKKLGAANRAQALAIAARSGLLDSGVGDPAPEDAPRGPPSSPQPPGGGGPFTPPRDGS
jgi:LuxR family transcriptional regulator, quorum-sensing system regulator CviR